jgi:hypothetical protein
MANCSSASGSITFKNKDLTDLARFIYYFNKLNGYAYYGTYIDDLYNLDYNQTYEFVKENALLNDNKEYELEFSFIGTGRWTYCNNLDWFFNIKKENDIITNYNKLVLGTTIDVDFIDEEGGCDKLYTYKASLHAKPNKYNEFDTVRENEEHVGYEHTAENIRYLLDDDVYSIDDAIKYPNNYFNAEALSKYHTEILEALENNEDRSIMYDFANFKEVANLESLFPDIEKLYVR